jgi:hypothetical protein
VRSCRRLACACSHPIAVIPPVARRLLVSRRCAKYDRETASGLWLFWLTLDGPCRLAADCLLREVLCARCRAEVLGEKRKRRETEKQKDKHSRCAYGFGWRRSQYGMKRERRGTEERMPRNTTPSPSRPCWMSYTRADPHHSSTSVDTAPSAQPATSPPFTKASYHGRQSIDNFHGTSPRTWPHPSELEPSLGVTFVHLGAIYYLTQALINVFVKVCSSGSPSSGNPLRA